MYFTSILSNALENAIHAAEKMPEDERLIILKLHSEYDKLLLLIKNSSLPDSYENFDMNSIKDFRTSAKTLEEKHGLGTQSIRYLCEQLGGNCQFSVEDGMFVLKAIL